MINNAQQSVKRLRKMTTIKIGWNKSEKPDTVLKINKKTKLTVSFWQNV